MTENDGSAIADPEVLGLDETEVVDPVYRDKLKSFAVQTPSWGREQLLRRGWRDLRAKKAEQRRQH
jgi:hypothetical protein